MHELPKDNCGDNQDFVFRILGATVSEFYLIDFD